MRTSRIASFVLAVALLGGACSADVDDARRPPAARSFELVSAVRPFDSCDAVLSHLRTEALARVGPFGLAGLEQYYAMEGDVAVGRAIGGDEDSAAGGAARLSLTTAAAPGPADQAGEAAFSGTNVQEAGVDELDTVKTDGRRLFVAREHELVVMSLEGGDPRRLGAVELAGATTETYAAGLLLDGDRALVLSSGWRPVPVDQQQHGLAVDVVEGGAPVVVLSEIDLSDATNPRVTDSLEVDGELVSARLVDGTARVVLRSAPKGLGFVYPQADTQAALDAATTANRQAVEAATLESWLPQARRGTAAQPLIDCAAMSHPDAFSGFSTVSVLTDDLRAGGLGDGAATGLLADAQTVYASTSSLYVAATRWPEGPAPAPMPIEPLPLGNGAAVARSQQTPPEVTTEIHRFDIAGTAPALYLASGTVDGTLLNQYSLSEHDNVLRVATTDEGWWAAGTEQAGDSQVVVFRQDGTRLVEIGRVGGLGKGERIYAVRFIGTTGYVVTFRQTDPLYTIDLRDPTAPRVVGELKIPGYSAYLHPVGDGVLLGIGQNATEEGIRTGVQASLFDVRDPARPQRVGQLDLGTGETAAEYDPHAFLWWEPTGLVTVPLSTWCDGSEQQQPCESWNGLVGLGVDGGTLGERGRLGQGVDGAVPQGTIMRSLVAQDALFAVSELGVFSADLDTLAPGSYAAFG
jgi:hypothetical protein